MVEESERTPPGRLGKVPPAIQWAVLIALSLGLSAFLVGMHAPAALLLGPLIAGVVAAANGARVRFSLHAFVVAQGIIGCMIAKMVPLSIVGDLLGHWPLFTVGVFSVVIASTVLGWVMTRMQVLPGTTALWGLSPGAASVMTLMAEAYGADIRLVAFMQYLRVVLVAAVAAVVARLFGVNPTHHADAIVWFPEIAWAPLLETCALAVVGPILARLLRIPAGAFLVPLVLGSVLTHFGLMTIELPTWLLVGSYTLVGWNIGLRFTRPLLVHAMRSLPRVLAGALSLIAICGLVGGLLVVVAGIDPLTAYLATSPGGADSIAIIAASSNVDVSFVMTMQTVRLIAVLFLGPSLTKFVVKHIGDVTSQGRPM